jgi:nicotinate-nucleotide adenylyltransferase
VKEEGKKIGIFGGTFDPVHIGHLLAARQALELAKLDEIWFMPTYKNPLKDESTSSLEDRVKMLELGLEDREKIKLSLFDVKNKSVYTVDSLKALKKAFPQHEFYFMMGSNLVSQFAQWREPKEILKLVKLIIVVMPDFPGIQDPLIKKAKPLMLEPLVKTTVSSTILRERVRKGHPIKNLVPEKVRLYIEEKKLYR